MTTMDTLIPVSRDTLLAFSQMQSHIRYALQIAINEVIGAASAGKTSHLLDGLFIARLRGPGGFPSDVPGFIALLVAKFPGCKIEQVNDQWYDVDAYTRKKVSGIKIDWA